MALAFLFLTVFALGAVALLVSTLTSRWGSPAQFVLTILPALLVITVVGVRGGDGTQPTAAGASYRVTLSAARMRLAAGEPVTIGGDAQKDHLYVAELPPHLLTLRPDKDGQLRLEPQAGEPSSDDGEPTLTGNALGLVVYRVPQDRPGALESQDTDPELGGTVFPPSGTHLHQLCVPAPSGKCDPSLPALSWKLEHGAVQLYDGATRLCVLPDGGRQPRARSSLYPLAAFAREECRTAAPFSWNSIEPAADFLYWGGSRGHEQLYVRGNGRTALVVMDEGGHAVPVGDSRRVLAPPAQGADTELEVHLYRYPLNSNLPTPADADDPAAPGAEQEGEPYSRLTERRSFRLRYSQERDAPRAVVELFLDTPEQQQLVLGEGSRQLSLVSLSATTGARIVPGSLGFRTLGGPLAAALSNTIEPLSREDAQRFCAQGTTDVLLVQGPAGASCARLGHSFVLGDPDKYEVRMRIASLTQPLGFIWAIALLVTVNLLIRLNLKVSVGQSVVLGFLEMLLALRVLIAFDAAALDPAVEDTVANAWLALLWVPLAFELVPRAGVSGAWALVLKCVKVAFVLAGTYVVTQAQGAGRLQQSWALLMNLHEGRPGRVLAPALAVMLVTVALLTRPPWLRAPLGRLLGAFTGVLQGLTRQMSGVMRRRGPAEQALPAPTGSPASGAQWAAAVAPLLLVMGLHAALVGLGVREQLKVAGERIAVAAFIVPLLVLAWAWLDLKVTEQAARGRPGTLPSLALTLLPFLPLLIFTAAHDSGAYIYFLAPAALLCARALPREAGGWWASILVALGAVCAIMAALGRVSVFHGLAVPALLLMLLSLGALAAVILRSSGWREPQTWRPLPLLTLALLFVSLHLVGFWADYHSPAADAADTAGQPIRVSAMRGVDIDTKLLRIMNQVIPESVELLGTREAYEQRNSMLEMYDYASSFEGRGWPQSAAPRELRDTHINDTVTAVHILSPFGVLGGIGVAGFLLMFVAAVFNLADGRPGSGARAAELAALVLAFTSLYMLLANLGIVPFTGRNFYFLSVKSESDLIEGGLLLAITLAGVSTAGKEEKT